MKRLSLCVGLIAALSLSLASAPVRASDIDEIVFFGDSLSDTGNIWFALGGVPGLPYFQGSNGAAPEYTGGQWSSPEGPSWPTLFASRFGLMATPSLASLVGAPEVNNYAFGGARTGINGDPSGAPWLDQQVAIYAASLGGNPAPEGTLVSIMIGGNDVANNLGDDEALAAGITSITTQINNLYGLGVRQFLIANVPDIGATPRFQDIDAGAPGTAAFATFKTAQWNTALKEALAQLNLPGAVIDDFDFFTFGKNPELLAGFANTTDACLTETSLCANPASYFYWDSFHPSSTSHALLAEGLSQTLVPTRLQQLLDDVTGVGPGRFLERTVKWAQRAYARDRVRATCGALRIFQFTVKLLSYRRLNDEQANRFTSHAETIREALSCH
ncbi:MAG: SGNH/GDSL hydrolase family protein [Woeseiaceae bacterium]|nr:SGNH/GDSL hydrolase family protein [Woeseiaceae bacterium]